MVLDLKGSALAQGRRGDPGARLGDSGSGARRLLSVRPRHHGRGWPAALHSRAPGPSWLRLRSGAALPSDLELVDEGRELCLAAVGERLRINGRPFCSLFEDRGLKGDDRIERIEGQLRFAFLNRIEDGASLFSAQISDRGAICARRLSVEVRPGRGRRIGSVEGGPRLLNADRVEFALRRGVGGEPLSTSSSASRRKSSSPRRGSGDPRAPDPGRCSSRTNCTASDGCCRSCSSRSAYWSCSRSCVGAFRSPASSRPHGSARRDRSSSLSLSSSRTRFWLRRSRRGRWFRNGYGTLAGRLARSPFCGAWPGLDR